MVEDSGRGWRRVVPLPTPGHHRRNWSGAAGKGRRGHRRRRQRHQWSGCQNDFAGREAVIDKDLAGQRLAMDVGADLLIILTDVEAVAINWGKPDQQFLRRLR